MVYVPKYLSATSLDLWKRCPSCWARRYVEHHKGAGNPGLFFGQAMSKALEWIHNGMDPSLAWVRAHNYFDAIASLEHGSLDRGLALLKDYENRGIFVGRPEAKIRISVDGIDIVGYRDLATDSGFVEYKTGKSSWTQKKVDSEIQASIYWLGHREETGEDPKHATYVIMPTKGPTKVILLETTRTDSQLEDFRALVKKSWDEMQQGVYPARCSTCRGQQGSVRNPNPPVFTPC